MSVDLRPLLKVREIRERAAERALGECQRALRARRAELDGHVQARDRFGPWRVRREADLFAGLQADGGASVAALDDYFADLDALKRQGETLMAEVAAAEKRLGEAQRALAEARDAWREASRNAEKMREFVAAQQRERERLREAGEEKELEEYRAPAR